MNIEELAQKPLKENFYLKMQEEIKEIQTLQNRSVPKLLLHSCCGPCSSAVLEVLAPFFEVTVFYDNPNIYPKTEYCRRRDEQKRLIIKLNEASVFTNKISFYEQEYLPQRFYDAVSGYENLPEGSLRCFFCYEFRMRSAMKFAITNKFDYMTTTLSVSPHKNSLMINNIGLALEKEFADTNSSCANAIKTENNLKNEKKTDSENDKTKDKVVKKTVVFLQSDFKKKNGYKRSFELSSQYELYRQWYCGCVYSMKEAIERKNNSIAKTEKNIYTKKRLCQKLQPLT